MAALNERYRSRLVDGQLQRTRYTLEEPAMHALYRNKFNAVDVVNHLSQGPGCLSEAWATYNVVHCLFAGSLSACVTNAYQVWLQTNISALQSTRRTNSSLIWQNLSSR
jgi:hypothetical protein